MFSLASVIAMALAVAGEMPIEGMDCFYGNPKVTEDQKYRIRKNAIGLYKKYRQRLIRYGKLNEFVSMVRAQLIVGICPCCSVNNALEKLGLIT